MKLTKHEHACVVVEKDGASFVIDPGSFSRDAAGVISGAEAILLTHEHFDHVHEAAIKEALAARPGLRVYAPAALAGAFDAGQFTAVSAGDELAIAGFTVTVHGGTHAVIHPDIPAIANVGYLVDGTVYHPGDAYFVPDAAVETLCAAILKAPRPAILGVKEYVKTAPDMAVYGAVEFARNLHATVNSSGEMRRKH